MLHFPKSDTHEFLCHTQTTNPKIAIQVINHFIICPYGVLKLLYQCLLILSCPHNFISILMYQIMSFLGIGGDGHLKKYVIFLIVMY